VDGLMPGLGYRNRRGTRGRRFRAGKWPRGLGAGVLMRFRGGCFLFKDAFTGFEVKGACGGYVGTTGGRFGHPSRRMLANLSRFPVREY